MLETIHNTKQLKRKNFKLTKQMKLPSLISWIGMKSKRKKKRVRFCYYLERFRLWQSNEQQRVKEMWTLNSKVNFVSMTLAKQLKKKRRKRYWFIRKRRYKYNSFTVLKNYCISNFKKDYKNGLTYRRYKKKSFIKHRKYRAWRRNLKTLYPRFVRKIRVGRSILAVKRIRKGVCWKTLWERKRVYWTLRWTNKGKKQVPVRGFVRTFKKKKKLHRNLVVTNEKWLGGPEWRQEWELKTFRQHRPNKKLKRNRKKFGRVRPSKRKSLMPLITQSLLFDLKFFKKYYNFEYILARGAKEINIEEMDAAGYIKEYSQTGFRWRFKERRSQQKCLPWLQILIANRNLYLFQNYNMLRRKRPKFITKKNQIYKAFLMATHHRFQKIKLKPGKRGGNRYIWLRTNLLKSFLPHLNRMHKKSLKNIWSSFAHVKSKYLTRDMKFWNQLNLSFYSSPQLVNWMPNALWSNLLVKKGWVGLATNCIAKAPWAQKCNFPLLTNLNTKLTMNKKNLIRNPSRILRHSDVLQINPYIKRYFLRFFNRKSKWNKKPIHAALDRNQNYNAVVVNSFTHDFRLSFKNRYTKANMKYLKIC